MQCPAPPPPSLPPPPLPPLQQRQTAPNFQQVFILPATDCRPLTPRESRLAVRARTERDRRWFVSRYGLGGHDGTERRTDSREWDVVFCEPRLVLGKQRAPAKRPAPTHTHTQFSRLAFSLTEVTEPTHRLWLLWTGRQRSATHSAALSMVGKPGASPLRACSSAARASKPTIFLRVEAQLAQASKS